MCEGNRGLWLSPDKCLSYEVLQKLKYPCLNIAIFLTFQAEKRTALSRSAKRRWRKSRATSRRVERGTVPFRLRPWCKLCASPDVLWLCCCGWYTNQRLRWSTQNRFCDTRDGQTLDREPYEDYHYWVLSMHFLYTLRNTVTCPSALVFPRGAKRAPPPIVPGPDILMMYLHTKMKL